MEFMIEKIAIEKWKLSKKLDFGVGWPREDKNDKSSCLLKRGEGLFHSSQFKCINNNFSNKEITVNVYRQKYFNVSFKNIIIL